MSGEEAPQPPRDGEESGDFEASQSKAEDAPIPRTSGAYGSFEEEEAADPASPNGDSGEAQIQAPDVSGGGDAAADADPSSATPAADAVEAAAPTVPPAEATAPAEPALEASGPSDADVAPSADTEASAPVEPTAEATGATEAGGVPAADAEADAPVEPTVEAVGATEAEGAPSAEAEDSLPAPADDNAFSIAEAAGSLHLAAKCGKVETVQFLLRNNANLEDLDADGKTALEVAESAGHPAVSQVLRDAMGLPPKETGPSEPDAAAAPAPAPEAAAGPKEGEDAARATAAAERPRASAGAPPTAPAGEQTAAGQKARSAQRGATHHGASTGGMSRSMSSPGISVGGFRDLKARTALFGSITIDGVNKGPTFAGTLSSVKSSPKYSMGVREKNPSFIRSSSTPAPGTYNVTDNSGNTKFAQQPTFRFGGERRWGAPSLSLKRQPGPGAYQPKDPALTVSPKVGFGSSNRLQGAILAHVAPGPGAYEMRSTLGESRAFTARGRHVSQFAPTKSMPGPGAYSPVTTYAMKQGPKAGFGTSRRDGLGALRGLGPGPGSYELQNHKNVGTDAPKTSMTSRRRVTDIDSYLTPGPGSYNSHSTCFGGP